MGGNYGRIERQDIQSVNIKAEQLAGYRKHYLNITTSRPFNLKRFALLFMTSPLIFMTGPKRRNSYEFGGGTRNG
jgi:hypothetical protein